MKTIVVVDRPGDWPLTDLAVELVSAKEYISTEQLPQKEAVTVLNLCRSYGYQRTGYYVSLLAAARGHRPQPSVLCMEDLKSNAYIRNISKETQDDIQKSLAIVDDDAFNLSIYFGKSVDAKFNALAQKLCKLFPAPFLQARFQRTKDSWVLVNIFPLALDKIPEEHKGFATEQTKDYLAQGGQLKPARKRPFRYELAILTNPSDPTPPSNKKALREFVRAAEERGFRTELIEPGDFGRVPEFDALFIRATTQVNDITFRFARRASAHGVVVLDDPQSILFCTNKIYCAEYMRRKKLPTPATQVINVSEAAELAPQLQYPLVLKQPDSSFSRGVVLVEDQGSFVERAREFGKQSDLILAQTFMPSEYDWRITLLGGKPMFACKYFMVRDHWQIYRQHAGRGEPEEGAVEVVPLPDVAPGIIKLATDATRGIGNGFYGVDIKEVNGKYYIIEVNDNPSIDAGFEDQILGKRVYEDVMDWFLNRVEARARGNQQ